MEDSEAYGLGSEKSDNGKNMFVHFGVFLSYCEPGIESQGALREQKEHFATGTYFTTLILGLKK